MDLNPPENFLRERPVLGLLYRRIITRAAPGRKARRGWI
jgi:hypothetical protein